MAMTDISSNAMEVLKRRYLAKDENGRPVETVEQMIKLLYILNFRIKITISCIASKGNPQNAQDCRHFFMHIPTEM